MFIDKFNSQLDDISTNFSPVANFFDTLGSHSFVKINAELKDKKGLVKQLLERECNG